MAKRYIGDAVIHITYNDAGDYRGKVRVGEHTWDFKDLHAPICGFGAGVAYDSREAYDAMAASAVSFGGYYATYNRGEDTPDWAPPADVADAINDATMCATDDSGRFGVQRFQNGPVRMCA